ncbi:MAG: hypothetical protein MZV49_11870 [Rhodopseudomonas palustris]|nr:hypothetical protein [Rhodopseudomonas palustris]
MRCLDAALLPQQTICRANEQCPGVAGVCEALTTLDYDDLPPRDRADVALAVAESTLL